VNDIYPSPLSLSLSLFLCLSADFFSKLAIDPRSCFSIDDVSLFSGNVDWNLRIEKV